MPPITWRSVQRPDFTEAQAAFGAANASFNAGADRLVKTIEGVQQAQVNQVQGRRQLNESNFRDYLQSFANPDDLAAAQASGEIDRQLAGYAGVIDQDAVRGAADQRLNALRESANQSFEYENTKRQQADQDVIAGYDARIAEIDLNDPNAVASTVQQLKAQVRADLEAGRISQQGATGVLKGVGETLEASEEEVNSDQDRVTRRAREAFSDSRTQLEATRDDAKFGRDEATRVRIENIDNLENQFYSLKDRATSATDLRNQFVESLNQMPGVRPEEIAAATARFDARLGATTQIAAADEAQFAAAEDSLRAGVAGNVFTAGREQLKEKDAATTSAEILQEFRGEESTLGTLIDTNRDGREKIGKDVIKAMTDGINVYAPDGTETKVQMPPGLVRAAMSAVKNNWGPDSTVEQVLQEYFLNNKDLMAQLNADDAYRTQVNQLQSARDTLRFKQFTRDGK